MNNDLNTNNQSKNAVNSCLGLSSHEIIIRFGMSVLADNCFYSDAPTIRESYMAARDWFEINYHKIKAIICGSRKELRCGRNEAIYAVADVLISYFGGLPMVFVSIYVVDYGLDKFCKSSQKDFIDNLPVAH